MNTIQVRSSRSALVVAGVLTKVIDAEIRLMPADVTAEDFLRSLADSQVVLGVLDRDDRLLDIARRSPAPLLVVPPEMADDYALERVLIPLDGTDETAHAVAAAVGLFSGDGIEVIVLHVFDSATVPAHWDQAAHERAAWEHEFLARFCAPYLGGSHPTLTLRSGAPGENILDVAAAQSDLMVLGWSQQTLPGRASIIRETLVSATVPVMLVPRQ